jgi:hypothetical protein
MMFTEIINKLTGGELFFLLIVIILAIAFTITGVAHAFGRNKDEGNEGS